MKISISTKARDQALDITSEIDKAIAGQGWQEGVCNLFVPHTTAAITVNEGYDPSVMADMLSSLDRLVPWHGNYAHMEGNSAAHLKAIMVGVSLNLPVAKGCLSLGQWQRVFFMEFDGPRKRDLAITFSSA